MHGGEVNQVSQVHFNLSLHQSYGLIIVNCTNVGSAESMKTFDFYFFVDL